MVTSVENNCVEVGLFILCKRHHRDLETIITLQTRHMLDALLRCEFMRKIRTYHHPLRYLHAGRNNQLRIDRHYDVFPLNSH